MKHFFTIFVLLLFFVVSNLPAQINWTKYDENPVLIAPGGSGSWNEILFPFCLLLEDNVIHQWYGAFDGTKARIGYATSADGISWMFDEQDPVLDIGKPGSWDDERILYPYVIFDGETYHMWYGGWNGSNVRIGYATSTDKVNWTKYAGNPVMNLGVPGSWDDAGVVDPCVYYDGTDYHMWYVGLDGARSRIGYASSADGINWIKHDGPVLSGNYNEFDRNVRAPEVFFDGTRYHMWYSGTTRGIDDRYYKIGYATSTDKITWTKSADNPVLTPSSGSWDSQWVGFCRVLWDSVNSQYKMWFGGGSDDEIAYGGYATAPDIIYVPDDFASIQEGIDAADSGDVVLVDEGTYYENINFKGKAITVASQYWFDGDTSHISKTIIDGSQPTKSEEGSVVSIVSGEDTTSVLCGFTITGGSGTYNSDYDGIGGGGIYMLAGGKIIHNIITNNHLENTGLTGGGGLLQIAQNNNINVIIKNNIFAHNSYTSHSIIPSAGGGVYCLWEQNIKGSLEICNNDISYNSGYNTGRYKAIAGGLGLSLYLPKAVNAIVENNLVTHNELHCQASMGAGIYVVYWEPGGTFEDLVTGPVIRNNIIAHNYSQDRGAGIGIWTVQKNHSSSSTINPQPAIINNTIVNNKANDGSGIFNFDSYPLLLNNILWDDLSVQGCREIFNDDITYPDYTQANEGELNIYYSDIQGDWKAGQGNMNEDPLFADTLEYNLLDSSPCIGKGMDFVTVSGVMYYCPSRDHFGNPRPNSIDDFVDMGAIESPYVTGLEELLKPLPQKVALKQNYPNPFNPSTTIEFSIPKTEFVTLKVYNLLGQEVATLVSEKLTTGEYKYDWDAGSLASGVYQYQLDAGEYQEIKKLVLLK